MTLQSIGGAWLLLRPEHPATRPKLLRREECGQASRLREWHATHNPVVAAKYMCDGRLTFVEKETSQ